VIGEHSGARRLADPVDLNIAQVERRQNVLGRAYDQDFALGHEEFVESVP
jgi:hypothetical protein